MNPYKIMLVDDEEEVRTSIIRKIDWQDAGFEVIGDAENGKEALEKIEQKSDVLIAPTIPYGACQSLAPYPGTIDIDNEVLYQFCRQIFLSLYRHGARKFVFLNGHGGNMKMIERLGLEFEDKGCLVAMLNWWLMAWDMNPAWKGGTAAAKKRLQFLASIRLWSTRAKSAANCSSST